jgi:hypothetical protein
VTYLVDCNERTSKSCCQGREGSYFTDFLKRGRLKIVELEIYRALIKINVSADDAQAVADSINKEIDKRYELHSSQLVGKADLAEAKVEIIKWTIGSMLASVGPFATITKLWH